MKIKIKYKISRHVRTEMERRNISQSLIESVLNAPGQVVSEKEDIINMIKY
ncbi:DUF4258 domain-containing protein [Nostoc sp.]|uniref:DUF4258 domain-containing protein n=1 Tax=Nostoc sp. TaxID=1180 RepID=UPI003FA5515C